MDAVIAWHRQLKQQLEADVSWQPDVSSPEHAAAHGSTRSKLQHIAQTGRCSESKAGPTDMETVAQVGFGKRQRHSLRCSWFYLQRRHDIPCPLNPATERCSPCSCCRRPSLANTSTAKRRVAKYPIGLRGAVPNSSKWRHWAGRMYGRQSQREERREGGRRGRKREIAK